MKLKIGPFNLEHELTFIIPPTDKIGIFMSGGLDSAALLSLIITELIETNRLDAVSITAFTIEKPTGEPEYADRILKKIENHFETTISHVNNIPNTAAAIQQGRMDHGVVTQTCEMFDGIMYLSGNNMPSADIKVFNGSLGFTYKPSSLYHQPFLNLIKPQLIDILYKLKMDFIIPYTHSCSTQMIGKCNTCYSCEERKWGFEQLALLDPETTNL